ncbi:hypothetical protein [Helicobacter mustelae]|nr:hypothetical protein [Helicobacter mustelae]
MLNFEMGFLGFLFINLANFWGLKNRITKEADSLRSLPKEQKKQKSSRLFLGLRISGLWARILAYALFGWGLYALMHSGRFSFVSCAIGIALSLFGILFLQFLQLKKQ